MKTVIVIIACLFSLPSISLAENSCDEKKIIEFFAYRDQVRLKNTKNIYYRVGNKVTTSTSAEYFFEFNHNYGLSYGYLKGKLKKDDWVDIHEYFSDVAGEGICESSLNDEVLYRDQVIIVRSQ